MDEDYGMDMTELLTSVDNAEVLSIFFPTFRKALIVDTRSNESQGPMVRIMPMAASPQERMRAIRRLRPGFPRLRNLTVVPWPRYVDSLVNQGIWQRIIGRFQAGGHAEALGQLHATLRELKRMERDELTSVVLGENYHTIWSSRN
ncbi:MAG: hypothetical protein FJ317_00125 [SAR202 cluster bacterium]|nr:hypothetical protein [SAR202 cluster bacterium]